MNYHNLPENIQLKNGTRLFIYIGDLTNTQIIERAKKLKQKYRKIRVFPSALKGKTDLWGNAYKPNEYVFIENINNHIQG